MARPEPLDLEKLREKINEKIKVVSMLGHLYIDGEYKGYVNDKEPLVVFVGVKEEDVNNLFDEFKQHIKSACEFYLRYMNNPNKLWEESDRYPIFNGSEWENSILRKLVHYNGESDFYFDRYTNKGCSAEEKLENLKNYVAVIQRYNEWLFKLAFEEVFENKKK